MYIKDEAITKNRDYATQNRTEIREYSKSFWWNHLVPGYVSLVESLIMKQFQNFTTNSIASILSEARKYKLSLIMAHQYMPQLKQEIRDAVLGNVGTIGAFRIGAEDAENLEKQFEPGFSRFDLVNLDNQNLIIKMMINNKISTPFKMKTLQVALLVRQAPSCAIRATDNRGLLRGHGAWPNSFMCAGHS